MKMEIIKKATHDEWKRLANTNLGATMIKNSIRFEFERTNDPDTNQAAWDEINNWCIENVTGIYYIKSWNLDIGSEIAYFEFSEDAVGFKLKFG